MLNLKKVAVTGGLSCGKSSVCRFFKELGAFVVSSDEIVHQLLSPNTNLGQQVILLIGPDIVVNGQINRGIIAKKVFSDQKLLESLERLLHPAVIDEIQKPYQQVKDSNKYSLFIAEIPLLFEIGAEKMFDYSIAVIANFENCKQRFMASTGQSEKDFLLRMAHQLSPDDKAQKADFVIENDGSLQKTKDEVKKIYNQLLNL